MSKLLLGCIADDFTGAYRSGQQRWCAPACAPCRPSASPMSSDAPPIDADAHRRGPQITHDPEPADAVAQSLAACRWLQGARCATQIYFKVCSTFDSTPRGNIGPVMEALMDELDCRFTIATPAFPDNGRTVFKGHLFVGDVLLSDSGMRNHPLTPMTDANLVRVLQAQLATARSDGQAPRRVGLVEHRATGASPEAIGDRFRVLASQGVAIAIADAVDNEDLLRLGVAVRDLPLVCAGSGLAIGLPANFGLVPSPEAVSLPKVSGPSAIVSGSCSEATNAQVAAFMQSGGAARRVDPLELGAGEDATLVDDIARWAEAKWASSPGRPVLVYSTAPTQAVAAAQARLGAHDVGARIESLLAGVTRALVEHGARRLVVAGGETSGAAVQALGVRRLRIGAQIDPGVPWCHAAPDVAADGLHLALKSGNFGAVDFFTRAFAVAT